MNVQFAIQKEGDGRETIYVLEVNPRASRTVPFVSEAASRSPSTQRWRTAGIGFDRQGIEGEWCPRNFSVKESVFPFAKFPGVDPLLGPEMRSTGEVMGVGQTFGEALFKSQLGASAGLPERHGVHERQGLRQAESHRRRPDAP